jgi:DNA-binding NtrC family response regulator
VAKVVLVGADAALLEGLAQTLLGFGHEVSFATTVGEVAGTHGMDPAAIGVVSADALLNAGLGATLPLAAGGALIVYGTSHEDRPLLPTKLQRSTLAYLVLPLERHRLIALVQSFESRSRITGRRLPDAVGDEPELGAF